MKSYDNYSSDNEKWKPQESLEGKQDTVGHRLILFSEQKKRFKKYINNKLLWINVWHTWKLNLVGSYPGNRDTTGGILYVSHCHTESVSQI